MSSKVLVVGSGAREHTIAHILSQSKDVDRVYVAPGNPGMLKNDSGILLENIAATDIQALLDFALKEKITLTVVGPEATLSEGIVDLFLENNLNIVGSSKKASMLETSKAFAKKIMLEAGVPTAGHHEFFDSQAAIDFIKNCNAEKMVVKCDGLAAGKGVIVCQSKVEAMNAVLSLMEKSLLGKNVEHIIIEDLLEGIEVSAFALCDGDTHSFLGTACDHKRLRDGDLGPNTGGMGAFSPASVFSVADEVWINENVFTPMLLAMKKNGIPFSGILFAGLMKTKTGWNVLEFNVRLGDPETQVLLPLIDEDLFPWFLAAAKGSIKVLQDKLGRLSPKKKDLGAVHVVMAAHGYPGTEGIKIRSGDEIIFDNDLVLGPNDFLYFAGVGLNKNRPETKGGRVLGVTSLADSVFKARESAYQLISKIHFDGAQYRRDIGAGQA